jgi:hypothetical protein
MCHGAAVIHLLAAEWGPQSDLDPFELLGRMAPFHLIMLIIFIAAVVWGRKHRKTREREQQQFQKLYPPQQQYPHPRQQPPDPPQHD